MENSVHHSTFMFISCCFEIINKQFEEFMLGFCSHEGIDDVRLASHVREVGVFVAFVREHCVMRVRPVVERLQCDVIEVQVDAAELIQNVVPAKETKCFYTAETDSCISAGVR